MAADVTAGVWSRTLRVLSSDVDVHRRMRPSRLLTLLQEAAIAHTEELGAGRDRTLDRGILWVVTMQRLEVRRMPTYDDEVTLESWPGPMMHVLFPRYYRMTDVRGDVLMEGSSLWMLVDEQSRKMAFPERVDVSVPGLARGDEPELPRMLAVGEGAQGATFAVPFSYCDLNGHMNNARYLDLVCDHADFAQAGREVRGIQTEFAGEVRMHDELCLSWTEDEEAVRFVGRVGDKTCCKVVVDLRP